MARQTMGRLLQTFGDAIPPGIAAIKKKGKKPETETDSLGEFFPQLVRFSAKLAADKLAANGDSLQFEVPATQKSGRSDKLARRQILGGEIALINGIEFVKERQIRAGNLHIHQVVHRHARLRQSPLQTIEHELDLILDFLRR